MRTTKASGFTILLIEDDDNDRFIIQRAFRQNEVSDPIQTLSGGNQAIAYLKGEGEYADRSRFPYPSLLITDLKMPSGDGFSVLEFLKQTPHQKIVPVLVLSASRDDDDIKRAYELGASCYLQKPSETKELRRLLKLFHDFWKECQLPQVDESGKQMPTSSSGKLGERFDE